MLFEYNFINKLTFDLYESYIFIIIQVSNFFSVVPSLPQTAELKAKKGSEWIEVSSDSDSED